MGRPRAAPAEGTRRAADQFAQDGFDRGKGVSLRTRARCSRPDPRPLTRRIRARTHSPRPATGVRLKVPSERSSEHSHRGQVASEVDFALRAVPYPPILLFGRWRVAEGDLVTPGPSPRALTMTGSDLRTRAPCAHPCPRRHPLTTKIRPGRVQLCGHAPLTMEIGPWTGHHAGPLPDAPGTRPPPPTRQGESKAAYTAPHCQTRSHTRSTRNSPRTRPPRHHAATRPRPIDDGRPACGRATMPGDFWTRQAHGCPHLRARGCLRSRSRRPTAKPARRGAVQGRFRHGPPRGHGPLTGEQAEARSSWFVGGVRPTDGGIGLRARSVCSGVGARACFRRFRGHCHARVGVGCDACRVSGGGVEPLLTPP